MAPLDADPKAYSWGSEDERKYERGREREKERERERFLKTLFTKLLHN